MAAESNSADLRKGGLWALGGATVGAAIGYALRGFKPSAPTYKYTVGRLRCATMGCGGACDAFALLRAKRAVCDACVGGCAGPLLRRLWPRR